MKLIEKFSDGNKAHDLQVLLKSNGIPSNLNENKGLNVPNQYDVWVYINTQYPDAVQLLKNKSHIVNDKVDVEDFYKKLNSKEYNDMLVKYKSKFILYSLIFLIVVVTMILFLFY